jgi:hypothetical protein
VHRWSGANNYFMMSGSDCLAVGGGGAFGLYLDGDMMAGTSSACPTFNSPPLAAGDSTEFTCVSLEVWGFSIAPLLSNAGSFS